MSVSSDSPIARAGWRFDNTYARLPDAFHSRVHPTPVATPHLVLFNRALARTLGLDPAAFEGPDAAALFAGNAVPPGAEPIAQAYAGHQFGNLTRLGDGRAILMGEQLSPSGGRFDLQWKGSGPTPYSRGSDGRAALGPMLREYLISEAMHALKIPTTRSLAVAATGQPVHRETALPGAVLMRVAASHIRVGTFELFAALGDHDSLRLLAEHTVQRHFPHRASADGPALGLLEEAIERQAALIAQWMRVGFVHGVMNTDNMALSGETIDYGPCAFIDAYHPGAVFSSIDHHGRYAFGQQPGIAAWNLARLAEALLPIVHPTPAAAVEQAQAVLDGYSARFEHHWLGALRGKLGLFNEEPDDEALGLDLLQWMQDNGADYTRTFRALAAGRASSDADSRAETGTGPDATAAFAETGVDMGAARDAFALWHQRWAERLARQPQAWPEVVGRLRAHNPAIIPRNHAVQAALDAASTKGDLKPVLDLLAAFAAPYEEAGQPPALLHPPPPGTPPCRTFCGT